MNYLDVLFLYGVEEERIFLSINLDFLNVDFFNFLRLFKIKNMLLFM